jgi:hypothetical protein
LRFACRGMLPLHHFWQELKRYYCEVPLVPYLMITFGGWDRVRKRFYKVLDRRQIPLLVVPPFFCKQRETSVFLCSDSEQFGRQNGECEKEKKKQEKKVIFIKVSGVNFRPPKKQNKSNFSSRSSFEEYNI